MEITNVTPDRTGDAVGSILVIILILTNQKTLFYLETKDEPNVDGTEVELSEDAGLEVD